MAYTGIPLLIGDDIKVFEDYVDELMGGRAYRTEMTIDEVAREIMDRSEADFMRLCSGEE